MNNPYVKVTFKVPGKRRTMWAKRLESISAIRRYVRVDGEGEPTEPREIVLLTDADVITEREAVMNLHYGSLEIT